MSKLVTAGTFKPEKGRARKLTLDSGKLIKTRMLVTANSGGGKSYLMRVLLEQLGRGTPIIVLDREGEYVTLGEKLDVVQVGPLGEIPTAVGSAAILCRRLMEKRLSGVIDMSDLKLGEQRTYVKHFLDELVSLPKKLWRPTFIALDEAHIFAPESGHGEAESLEAVINAATLGRKRGYCTIFATQRISKFHKDAAADQTNRFFGRTTLDVDMKRAAKDLGMPEKDAREILRKLKPGEFYCYGPALSEDDVVRMHVAKAETTHPEAGQGRTLRPPKPSRAIVAALKELTDLPKEAEQEIRDLKAAKSKIAELDRELKHRPKETTVKEKTVEVSSRRDQQTIARLRAGLEAAMKMIKEAVAKKMKVPGIDRAEIKRIAMKHAEAITGDIVRLADKTVSKYGGEVEMFQRAARQHVDRLQHLLNATPAAPPAGNGHRVAGAGAAGHGDTHARAAPPSPATRVAETEAVEAGHASADDGSVDDGIKWLSPSNPSARAELTVYEQRVLDALAYWDVVGIKTPANTAVAFMASYSINTGNYKQACANLRAAGFMVDQEKRELTDKGRTVARFPESAGTLKHLHANFLKMLDEPSARVLRVLIAKYPRAIENEPLAMAAKYSINTGNYKQARASLQNFGLAKMEQNGMVATKVLFPDGLK